MEQPIYFPDNYNLDFQNDLETQELKNKNLQLSSALNTSMGGIINENLIQFQLDTKPYLQNIERYLCGGSIETDEYGNVSIVPPTDLEDQPLNNKGVAEFMRIISSYVTKETMLSVYDEIRIYEILADLGNELRKLLVSNYEKFGLDTEYKQSKFIVLILVPLNIIESCYRRAIGGKERDNIREGRIVTQSQPLGYNNNNMGVPMSNSGSRRRVNPFKPNTW